MKLVRGLFAKYALALYRDHQHVDYPVAVNVTQFDERPGQTIRLVHIAHGGAQLFHAPEIQINTRIDHDRCRQKLPIFELWKHMQLIFN